MDDAGKTRTVELLVIGRWPEDPRGVSFVVRCHSGSLRVGDLLDVKADPHGVETKVSLRCAAINLRPDLAVDELGYAWGGLVELEGDGTEDIETDWILRRR